MLPVTTKGELVDKLERLDQDGCTLAGRDFWILGMSSSLCGVTAMGGLMGVVLAIVFAVLGTLGPGPAILGTLAAVAALQGGVASCLFVYSTAQERARPLNFEQVQKLLQKEKRFNRDASAQIDQLADSYQTELRSIKA